MNFSNIKGITIPEGKVNEIVDSTGKSLWKAGPGNIYLKLIDRSISGAYTNKTVKRIGIGAFDSCTLLTTVNFPAVTRIDNAAFNSCASLTTVNFPAVTSIDNYAFDGCSALNTLILRSEIMATLRSTNAFIRTPIASGTGYIYVPAALVDRYKAATNWSTYANQIRAIEDYPEITGGETA